MAKWLLIPLTASLFISCEKKEQPVPESLPTSQRKIPTPTRIEPVAGDAASVPKQQAPALPETPQPQPKETAGTHKPEPPPSSEQQGYPAATPVEGLNGYVKSPYNDKIIDVRELPSGTLVQDPTYPAEEKKYFRVP